MLIRLQRSMKEKDQGFTLIELLVVIVIIGILAAIAIPLFLNQRKKAEDSAAKADVSTIGKEIAAYYVDGTGGLVLTSTAGAWKLDTNPTAGANGVLQGKLSSGNAVTAADASHLITSGTSFCVAVKNADAPNPWKYSAKNGLDKGACVAGDL